MLGITLLIFSLYLYHQKKFYSSLLLFFFFVTNGYQIVPARWLMAGLPIEKGTDLAIIYILFICCIKGRSIFAIVKLHHVFKWIILLLIFVTLSGFYSYFILEYPLTNVLQVYRVYLVLLSFVLFIAVPLPTLIRVFHTLALITLMQCILFLCQIVTGKVLLLSQSGIDEINTTLVEGTGFVRYYNSPVFLLPTFFYFLYVYRLNSKWLHYLAITILTLSIIGPMHRSLIAAVVAVLSLFVLVGQTSTKRIFYLAVIGLISYAASMISIVNIRINQALYDIANTSFINFNINNIDSSENNLVFRMAHFLERLEYVLNHQYGWIFGVGLISDNSPLAKKLPFNFGLISESTGEVIKIDTGDIVWSPLILTLGIVGTLIYILIIAKFLQYFYSLLRNSKYSAVGFLTVLTAVLISTAGTELITTTFRVLVLMLIVMVFKHSKMILILDKLTLIKTRNNE